MVVRLAILGLAVLSAGTAQAKPGMIYVMRHLERDAGTDPGLNAAGKAHAEQLAFWFKHDRPKAIFVTPFRRARETAAPLAAKLRVTPTEYDPRQQDRLIEAMRALKGPVLVIGHSNTVPSIVRALGGPAAPDLADNDYGRIWIVKDTGKSVRVVAVSDPQPR